MWKKRAPTEPVSLSVKSKAASPKIAESLSSRTCLVSQMVFGQPVTDKSEPRLLIR